MKTMVKKLILFVADFLTCLFAHATSTAASQLSKLAYLKFTTAFSWDPSNQDLKPKHLLTLALPTF